MLPCIGWRQLSTYRCACTMAYAWRPWHMLQVVADITIQMRICHVRTCKPWLILHSIGRRCLWDTHIPQLFLQDLVEAALHWSTPLARCPHVTLDIYIHWLIQPALGWYQQIDICRLRTMQEGLIWWFYTNIPKLRQYFNTTIDVGWPISAGYGWYSESPFKVAWPMS